MRRVTVLLRPVACTVKISAWIEAFGFYSFSCFVFLKAVAHEEEDDAISSNMLLKLSAK